MINYKSLAEPSPYLLLVLTTLFWSGNFVLGRAVHEVLSPIALSFWRWTVALLILLPFTAKSLRMQWPLIIRNWKILSLLSVLGIANYNTFAYIGLQSTTATNAVLMVSITPVLIVALSFLLFRSHVTSWQAVGITISLAGVGVIVTQGRLHSLSGIEINRGDAWIMASVLSWAVYSVCLKWRPVELRPLSFLSAIIFIGVLILLPFYLWNIAVGPPLELTAVTIGSIAYVGLFPSVLAYIFWNRAVEELGANRTGVFLHLIPAFGAIQSMLFLGERLRLYHFVGIALIGLGLYLTTARGQLVKG